MTASRPDILNRILARKQEEIEARRRQVSLSELQLQAASASNPRGFVAALESKIEQGRAAVIAEIKKASPSKGVIREDFVPSQIAASYQRGGAACLSVLTDVDFFQGADHFLQEAREACSLPVLRKDFTVDPYQVVEARVIGADAVLLIVRLLDGRRLSLLLELIGELGMDALVETHERYEIERAVACGARLLGINNRDLDSLDVDLERCLRLRDAVPRGCLAVAESGIQDEADLVAGRSACRSPAVHPPAPAARAWAISAPLRRSAPKTPSRTVDGVVSTPTNSGR